MKSENSLTPMMQQYLDIKRDCRDTILFYRMGDFYEMFYDDAVTASKILGLALTTRDKGRENPVPMCGLPYHSASSYISRLIRLGHKVAICEQSEPAPGAKGLVHREVVRVITPGLIVEDDHLTRDKANYLMAVSAGQRQDTFGIAFIDISTGDFRATEISSRQDFVSEVFRVGPSEILATDTSIIPQGFLLTAFDQPITPERAGQLLSSHFGTLTMDGFGLKDAPLALRASGMVLEYVRQTHKAVMPNITSLNLYNPGRFMMLGPTTKRNLELFDAISGLKEHTLFALLNRTGTSMGARMLADWMAFPLMDACEINQRLSAVEALVSQGQLLNTMREVLSDIPDMEQDYRPYLSRVCKSTGHALAGRRA